MAIRSGSVTCCRAPCPANALVQRRRVSGVRCNRLLAVECTAHLRNPLIRWFSLRVRRNDVPDWLLTGDDR